MEWSPSSAKNAYLDTLKLCSKHGVECDSCQIAKPESKELISALAAGMNAKLIVEVTEEASTSTIALAAAARQTGGKVVCILPEPRLEDSQKVIQDSGLSDKVEFKTEDPLKLLKNYKSIDFFYADCKAENYSNLLEMVHISPKRSVVVADNLVERREGMVGNVKGMENKGEGKGMEVTRIGKSGEFGRKSYQGRAGHSRTRSGGFGKSKWVSKVDEKSGEEHIFRMPISQ